MRASGGNHCSSSQLYQTLTRYTTYTEHNKGRVNLLPYLEVSELQATIAMQSIIENVLWTGIISNALHFSQMDKPRDHGIPAPSKHFKRSKIGTFPKNATNGGKGLLLRAKKIHQYD